MMAIGLYLCKKKGYKEKKVYSAWKSKNVSQAENIC